MINLDFSVKKTRNLFYVGVGIVFLLIAAVLITVIGHKKGGNRVAEADTDSSESKLESQTEFINSELVDVVLDTPDTELTVTEPAEDENIKPSEEEEEENIQPVVHENQNEKKEPVPNIVEEEKPSSKLPKGLREDENGTLWNEKGNMVFRPDNDEFVDDGVDFFAGTIYEDYYSYCPYFPLKTSHDDVLNVYMVEDIRKTAKVPDWADIPDGTPVVFFTAYDKDLKSSDCFPSDAEGLFVEKYMKEYGGEQNVTVGSCYLPGMYKEGGAYMAFIYKNK